MQFAQGSVGVIKVDSTAVDGLDRQMVSISTHRNPKPNLAVCERLYFFARRVKRHSSVVALVSWPCTRIQEEYGPRTIDPAES